MESRRFKPADGWKALEDQKEQCAMLLILGLGAECLTLSLSSRQRTTFPSTPAGTTKLPQAIQVLHTLRAC
jgi:hypothetical protein